MWKESLAFLSEVHITSIYAFCHFVYIYFCWKHCSNYLRLILEYLIQVPVNKVDRLCNNHMLITVNILGFKGK